MQALTIRPASTRHPRAGSTQPRPRARSKTSTPTFTTDPATLVIHQGTSLSVTVGVVPPGVIPHGTAVTFTGLPTGVTAAAGTLGADGGAAVVTLTAAATAPTGSFTISLQVGGVAYEMLPFMVYGAAGSVDVSFQGGYALDSTAGTTYNAIAVDSMGRIVAGGTTGGGDWLLRRYLPDGTADAAFNSAASQAMPAGSLNGLAIDLSTNTIVAVGANGSQLAIAVVAPDGSLAGNFNSGNVFVAPQTAGPSAGQAVVIDSPGSFYVAGSSGIFGNTSVGSAALLAGPVSETSIPSWTTLGKYTSADASTTFVALAKDATGHYVAAGTIGFEEGSVYVQRFMGTTLVGKTFMAAPDTYQGAGLAICPASGRAFAVGGDNLSGTGYWTEWSSDGTLIWNSAVASTPGEHPFVWRGAAPMPGDTEDRVYTVGYGGSNRFQSYIDRVVAVATEAGTMGMIDPSFGGANGVQISDEINIPTQFSYYLNAVTVQTNGLVLVAGAKNNTAMIGRFWP